jgi:hypothetical protein
MDPFQLYHEQNGFQPMPKDVDGSQLQQLEDSRFQSMG